MSSCTTSQATETLCKYVIVTVSKCHSNVNTAEIVCIIFLKTTQTECCHENHQLNVFVAFEIWKFSYELSQTMS